MLDFTRLMLISTQVEVVVEVGVELGKNQDNDNDRNSGHYMMLTVECLTQPTAMQSLLLNLD